jgi:hypothetical protein
MFKHTMPDGTKSVSWRLKGTKGYWNAWIKKTDDGRVLTVCKVDRNIENLSADYVEFPIFSDVKDHLIPDPFGMNMLVITGGQEEEYSGKTLGR